MFDERRQHPLMILFSALRAVTGIFFTMVFISLNDIMGGDIKRALLTVFGGTLALLILLGIYYLLSWLFFSYRYEDGYLYIKSGIVIKKNRSIKKERVQTVNISTGILQRLAGVATVRVETAGGGYDSELKLTAVTKEDARKLKTVLEEPVDGADSSVIQEELEHSGDDRLSGAQETKPAEQTGILDEPDYEGADAKSITAGAEKASQYSITVTELFLAGATSGGFLLLFSFLAAAISQFHQFIPESYIEYLKVDFLLEQFNTVSVYFIFAVVAVILSLLILSWFISTLIFMVKYANFTLTRLRERLQISWGFFEKKQISLKTHRLQAITIEEAILRQPFGLSTITAEVAGGGTKDQEYIMMLYLLLRKKKINSFMEIILPEYKLPQKLSPLPRRSLRRYIFRAVLYTLLPVIPLQFLSYGWLSTILFIPAIALGILRYNAGATCLEPNQLTIRFRNLNRYQVTVKRNHIQSMTISVNPFQRRAKLCTIYISVLSSPDGKTFSLTDLDAVEAEKIIRWYSRSHN